MGLVHAMARDFQQNDSWLTNMASMLIWQKEPNSKLLPCSSLCTSPLVHCCLAPETLPTYTPPDLTKISSQHTLSTISHSHFRITTITPKPLPQPSLFSFHKSFFHPGLNIRDIPKPYSSTHQQYLKALCKFCLEFVMDFTSLSL